MEHEDIQGRLEAFHDGELPARERSLVEEHLRSCADCRGALEAWAALARAAFPRPPVPGRAETERFTRAVMARLAPAARPSWDWAFLSARWLVPALGLGAAAVAGSLILPARGLRADLDGLLIAEGPAAAAAQWVAPGGTSDWFETQRVAP